ncbi:hypothetical protein B1L11_23575 [Microbispora sp. GKU 823]|nr:hypothetical protein B1L11_23575 [Microbispora sp. GKU 823]
MLRPRSRARAVSGARAATRSRTVRNSNSQPSATSCRVTRVTGTDSESIWRRIRVSVSSMWVNTVTASPLRPMPASRACADSSPARSPPPITRGSV